MRKVLVALPYHEAKRYSLDHALRAVQSLTYPQKEVVMRWDLAEYGGKDNVKRQREFFRKLCITGGFDYLYFMGVDTIPPKDVLERLIAHDKDIVGGVYWGRHDANNGRPEGAVAWIHDMSQAEQTETFKKTGQLLSIDGMGMDAVLISKAVLHRISWMDWEQNDDDYPFYDRAKQLGYSVYIDTDVQCKHFFTEVGYTHLATVKFND